MTTSAWANSRSAMVLAAGGACWLLTIGYLAVQPFVAVAWVDPGYSFDSNTISDLGNASCGLFLRPDGSEGYVCSPRHAVMNAAFIAVGALTAAGAILTRRWWPGGRAATTGLCLLVAAGIGGVLVGLAPADTNLSLHAAGALLQVPGAVGMLLLGFAAGKTGWLRVFSLVCGTIATVACVLFLAGVHLGLGIGGMERLAFDTLTVWTGVLGAAILRRRHLARPTAPVVG